MPEGEPVCSGPLRDDGLGPRWSRGLQDFGFSDALSDIEFITVVPGFWKPEEVRQRKIYERQRKLRFQRNKYWERQGCKGKDREQVRELPGWNSGRRKPLLPHNTSLKKLLCPISPTLPKLQSSPGLNKADGPC